MKLKKLLMVLLTVAVLFTGLVTTVSAASEAVPYYNQTSKVDTEFYIKGGVACVTANYSSATTLTKATITVTIQRKLWNLFWVSYDIGIPDNVWTETKTSSSGTFYNTFNIPDTGNYRCNFTIVLEGTGGTDTIEETINYSYN